MLRIHELLVSTINWNYSWHDCAILSKWLVLLFKLILSLICLIVVPICPIISRYASAIFRMFVLKTRLMSVHFVTIYIDSFNLNIPLAGVFLFEIGLRSPKAKLILIFLRCFACRCSSKSIYHFICQHFQLLVFIILNKYLLTLLQFYLFRFPVSITNLERLLLKLIALNLWWKKLLECVIW